MDGWKCWFPFGMAYFQVTNSDSTMHRYTAARFLPQSWQIPATIRGFSNTNPYVINCSVAVSFFKIFTPILGKWSNLTYFSNGLVQPPTRIGSCFFPPVFFLSKTSAASSWFFWAFEPRKGWSAPLIFFPNAAWKISPRKPWWCYPIVTGKNIIKNHPCSRGR